MRTILAAAALVLVAAHVAAAQPALTPLSDPETPPALTAPLAPIDHRAPPPAAGEKSELVATGLALGATAAGYALGFGVASHGHETAGDAALALIVIGPSAGHLYAGEGSHVLGMSAVRAGGLVTFAIGLMVTIAPTATSDEGAPCGSCAVPPQDAHWGGEAAMVVGGGAFVIGTVYDLLDAHRAVDRANRNLLGAMTVAPSMLHTPNGVAPGMALTGRW